MNQKLSYWLQNSEEKAKTCGNSIKAHDYRNENVFKLTQSYLLEIFQGKKDLNILDVGCGNGLFTKPLSPNHHVVGIDISPSMLQLASENGSNTVRSIAERLPFSTGVFDGACCIEMFQCVDTGDVIIKEMIRVLKPGGLLFVQTLNRSSLIRRLHRFIDAESKQLRMYTIRELMSYTDLPDIEKRTIIYNHYPFPWIRKSETPRWLSNLAATSFAIVVQKSALQ